jgi:malate permease and related proteins
VSITSLSSIFANSILPVFIIGGIGFLAARYLHADVKSLSALAFNVLAPCLIFYNLTTSTVSAAEFGRMALFTLGMLAISGLGGWLVTRLMHLRRDETSAFVNVAMFANAGTYGLPLLLFAYGQEAVARGVIYLAIQLLLLYTVGMLLATSGQCGLRTAIQRMLRLPHLYAIGAAMLFAMTRIPVPDAMLRPIALLNGAALPMMILLLGMQFERAVMPENLIVVGVATVGRLIILPAIAFVAAVALGFTGPDLQAAVLLSGMPAAVMITVFAIEFQTAPAFVTSVVFLTTLLSPITVTVLIALLQ